MPLYEFLCEHCDKKFEHLYKGQDVLDSWACPDCGALSRRLYSNFSFKFDFPTLDAQDIMTGEEKGPYGKEVEMNK